MRCLASCCWDSIECRTACFPGISPDISNFFSVWCLGVAKASWFLLDFEVPVMADRGEVQIPIGPNYLVLYFKKRVPVFLCFCYHWRRSQGAVLHILLCCSLDIDWMLHKSNFLIPFPDWLPKFALMWNWIAWFEMW